MQHRTAAQKATPTKSKKIHNQVHNSPPLILILGQTISVRNILPATLAATIMSMKRLSMRERKILRTGGLVLQQGLWRLRTNQELRELCKQLDIVADVKKKRWEWVGHVARMDQGRTVEKIFESKPEESRIRDDPE